MAVEGRQSGAGIQTLRWCRGSLGGGKLDSGQVEKDEHTRTLSLESPKYRTIDPLGGSICPRRKEKANKGALGNGASLFIGNDQQVKGS